MRVSPFHRTFAALAAGLSCLVPLGGSHAADASNWQQGLHSAARLIGAVAPLGPDGAVWRAGVELKLSPNWKTYWRYPGDSGIAPRFDFSASTNVRDVEVRWPAPTRFSDGVGSAIGYAREVVLPLRIRVTNPDAPSVLRLKLDYAICETLCVPVEARMELALRPATAAIAAALEASEARLPHRVRIGDGGALGIASVRRVTADGKPQLVVDVRAAGNVDLFAEGPNDQWSLPLPQPIPGAPAGLQRFTFALEGLPSGAEAKGATLTLTAVAQDEAVEASFHLD